MYAIRSYYVPIGKLQLYTAAAGVPPQGLLPMYLDAGTNNEQYLRDPLYMGLREPRPATEDLFSFVITSYSIHYTKLYERPVDGWV